MMLPCMNAALISTSCRAHCVGTARHISKLCLCGSNRSLRCCLDRDDGSGSVHVWMAVELLRVASTREDENDDEDSDDDNNGWNAERRSTTAQQAAVAKTVAAAVPRPSNMVVYGGKNERRRRAPAKPTSDRPARNTKRKRRLKTIHFQNFFDCVWRQIEQEVHLIVERTRQATPFHCEPLIKHA